MSSAKSRRPLGRPDRRGRSVTALPAEPPVPSQSPLDAAVVALQAADVPANVLLEQR
jgi:hypothetical protein